jgi:hypothetical protein
MEHKWCYVQVDKHLIPGSEKVKCFRCGVLAFLNMSNGTIYAARELAASMHPVNSTTPLLDCNGELVREVMES